VAQAGVSDKEEDIIVDYSKISKGVLEYQEGSLSRACTVWHSTLFQTLGRAEDLCHCAENSSLARMHLRYNIFALDRESKSGRRGM
jgi:hypothetical protein